MLNQKPDEVSISIMCGYLEDVMHDAGDNEYGEYIELLARLRPCVELSSKGFKKAFETEIRSIYKYVKKEYMQIKYTRTEKISENSYVHKDDVYIYEDRENFEVLKNE